MGILDDAIREHLELKRQHGADSTVVARQENEVFGPDDAPAPEVGSDSDPGTGAHESIQPPVEALGHDVGDDGIDPFDTSIHDIVEPAADPLAGSPLADSGMPNPAEPEATSALDALFDKPVPAPAAPIAPAPPAVSSALPAPAPAGADSETAARSGARRLSDEELAAWRKRLSERADRLAAQRAGGAAAPAPVIPPAAPAPAAPAAPAASSVPPLINQPTPPNAPKGDAAAEPPSFWSAGPPPAAPPEDVAPKTPFEPTPPEDGVPVDFFDAGEAADSAFAPEQPPEPTEPVADEHDVLDETPEFLEETPEHDRMWFEQKPPRDFDFG